MRWMISTGRGRVLPRKYLYRRCGWVVMGIVAGWLSVAPVAAQRPQLKRPEEAPVERPPEPTPKKLVNEPRAVGVLQLNSSGKGTLIPIAIRIDGKFYDASVYKANPVPMALDVGTVYEVEKVGQSEGLFTVAGALHNQNPNSATPWLGAGSYVVNGSQVATTVHKAEDKPRGLNDDTDAPPRLTRGKEPEGNRSSGAGSGGGGAAQKTAPAAGSQPASGNSGDSSRTGSGASSAPASAGAPGAGSSGDDSGRPQLKRANDSGGDESAKNPNAKASGAEANGQTSAGSSSTPVTSGQSGSGSSSAPQSQPGKDQSTQNQSGQGQSSQSAQNQSGQNYYRPTLRRGKPTESAPADTPDELTRTTETGISKNGTGVVTASAKLPVQLVPAISDAGGPLPQTFQFFWKEGEEEDRKKQMVELAANEVRAYLAAQAKDTIPAKPSATKVGSSSGTHSASAHKTAAKLEPEFEDVEFRAFDVWKNNLPVMILTAEAHLPEKAGASRAPTSTSTPMTYYVTIAARTDIYGDLRKLYAGITDRFHLDVTPKLELIDVVDADGDGRGEFLFRETTDAGNGYLIYRPTGDTLWKVFDSLNEG